MHFWKPVLFVLAMLPGILMEEPIDGKNDSVSDPLFEQNFTDEPVDTVTDSLPDSAVQSNLKEEAIDATNDAVPEPTTQQILTEVDTTTEPSPEGSTQHNLAEEGEDTNNDAAPETRLNLLQGLLNKKLMGNSENETDTKPNDRKHSSHERQRTWRVETSEERHIRILKKILESGGPAVKKPHKN